MKRQTLFTVLTALGLFLALGGTILAQGPGPQGRLPRQGAASTTLSASLGTSFTYQGRLTDGGSLADGQYDFEFELHDDPTADSPVASAVNVDDKQVADGLFTVQLDFGDVFGGDALYLAIGVRPGSSTGAYTPLTPRQALTAAPYALYARETAPHDHLTQTWTGSDNPLIINGSFSAGDEWAPLILENDAAGGAGLLVSWADIGLAVDGVSWDGLYVGSTGDDGVHVFAAGSPSTTTLSTDHNGFEVSGAEGNGLFIGRADVDGVSVHAAGWDGLFVESVGDDGVDIRVASDDGVYVGSAGGDGVHVASAGGYGVEVASATLDGVHVYSAGGYGVDVVAAALDGVHVYSATIDGVHVYSAGDDGVYANTTQASGEWGFYTPDKIYYGTSLAGGGPVMIVAQSGDDSKLETGDVVAVSGAGNPFAGGEAPVPLVRRASADDAVVGVVYRHFVSEEKVREVERDGKVERSSSPHTRSTEGAIAPGEYLLIVVLGPAQVKAAAVAGDIRPGDRLTAGDAGQVRKATPVKVGDAAFYPPGTIVGTAMEALDSARASGLVWVLVRPQ